MIRVLLVDDNADFREIFARLLERQPDMEVVAQAGSLAQARVNISGVDVAVIELELISDLRQASPGAAVLVMSATVEQAHPQEALEAGADGILDKISSPEEIISAIRRVGGG